MPTGAFRRAGRDDFTAPPCRMVDDDAFRELGRRPPYRVLTASRRRIGGVTTVASQIIIGAAGLLC